MPYTFCPKCGAKVEWSRSCSQCGARIPLHDIQELASTELEPQAVPWTVRDVLKGIVFFVVAQVVLFGIIVGIVCCQSAKMRHFKTEHLGLIRSGEEAL
jgi:uncharacterized membrane protein YvbJ